MAWRKSEDVYERLKNLPNADKAQAIRLWAAKEGKSMKDLVGIVINITGVKTSDQTKEIAQVWAPLLGLTAKRFVELAESFL
jgi:hypothetical protein